MYPTPFPSSAQYTIPSKQVEVTHFCQGMTLRLCGQGETSGAISLGVHVSICLSETSRACLTLEIYKTCLHTHKIYVPILVHFPFVLIPVVVSSLHVYIWTISCGWTKTINRHLGVGPRLAPANKTELLLISMHSSLIMHTNCTLRSRICSTYESELLVRNMVVGVRALHFSAGNMTRQLDLASFMLQADCGYCSYYRPQDENTTRQPGCNSNFHMLSAFVTVDQLFPPPFYYFDSFYPFTP